MDPEVPVEEDDRRLDCHMVVQWRTDPPGRRISTDPDSGRDETEEERLDRNLSELLQELRVALPGVQVLFAFLLAVPFQQGFEKITPFQKDVYFGTLICTAISAVMLISPSAYHRLTFRYQQKRRPRLLRQPLLDRRPRLPGAGDDRGDHADHRRPLRRPPRRSSPPLATMLVFGFFWFALPLQRRLSLPAGQEPLGKPEGD